MPQLSAVDMKLIDSLFDMYSGYVLDFTNSQFDAFFRRDVGVNIYDDAYALHGGSKGKRLRAFLETGQTTAVVKALNALWEYREAIRTDNGKKEQVHNARDRLSTLIQKLGGDSLRPAPSFGPNEATSPTIARPTVNILTSLEAEFLAMQAMNETPQARGYAFEKFLKKWFEAWGLSPRASFKLTGEQIDGSFYHRSWTYLIEARWRNSQADASALRSFQEKVGDRLEGARGLFISYSGFTSDGLKAFTAKRVILMDGLDVHDALERRISLDEIVATKIRTAIEERRPFVRVRDLSA